MACYEAVNQIGESSLARSGKKFYTNRAACMLSTTSCEPTLFCHVMAGTTYYPLIKPLTPPLTHHARSPNQLAESEPNNVPHVLMENSRSRVPSRETRLPDIPPSIVKPATQLQLVCHVMEIEIVNHRIQNRFATFFDPRFQCLKSNPKGQKLRS